MTKRKFTSVPLAEEVRPDVVFLKTFNDANKSYPRACVLDGQFIPERDGDGKATGLFFPSDESLLVSCDQSFRKKVGSGVVLAVDANLIQLLGADGSRKANYFIPKSAEIKVVDSDTALKAMYNQFLAGSPARFAKDPAELEAIQSEADYEGILSLTDLLVKYPKPTLEKDDLYVSDDVWLEIALNLELGENILLFGPTGTAKTKLSKYIAALRGTGLAKIDFGEIKNPISHLIGEHRIGADGTSKFELAVLPKAIQKSNTILFDELNRADQDAMNILFPVLDEDRTLRMDIAPEDMPRSIEVHPDVRFVATANIGSGYSGTNKIDTALEDRFKMIELDFMPEPIEVQLLHRRTKLEAKIGKLIVRVATQLRRMHENSEISRTVSVRGTIRIAQYAVAGFNLRKAFELALFPYFQKAEREQLNAIIAQL